MNGDIAPTNRPADTTKSMLKNGRKPSDERCHLSETGDQLHSDVGSPLYATSPVSENGEDFCAAVSGHEDCIGVGMF